MASGARTIRHLLTLAGVLCVASAASHGVVAQGARPDAVTIIQTFSETGRTDYRFRSRDEALAFIKTWPADVERWSAAGTPAESERRRHLAALTALEFGRTAFDAMNDVANRGLFEALLDAAHASLRRLPSGEFERQWLRATTGFLAAGANAVDAPPAHLEVAATRFPRDPRLRLNHVLADRDVRTLAHTTGTTQAELWLSIGHGDKLPVQPTGRRPLIGRAEDVFVDLLTDPEVGAEAAARLGWLRFHQNNIAESLALFDTAISTSSDPFVTNLAALGLGLTHLAAGHHDEATAAFRVGTAAMPTARAATTALAMQLFLAGQRQEAADLLDRLAGVPNALDPWKYVSGTERFVESILRGLRADLGVPPTGTGVVPAVTLPPVPVAQPAPAPAVPTDAAPKPPDSTDTRPLFTARTSSVFVDAAVMNGRRPVNGLVAADFEVRDNGVLQTVDDVSIEGLPLDVSVVLDLRESVYGRGSDDSTKWVLDATQQGVADTSRFSALLRPDDRLRIVTATRDVAEPHPLQGPGGRAVYRVPREGYTAAALYDAIFTALARRTAPDRRHLVLVFTDGFDGSSIVTSTQLLQAAARSDALVQVFRRDTVGEFFDRGGARDAGADFWDWDSRYLLWPHDTLLLPALAEATSGTLERVSATGQSVVADVKRTLDSFRQRYILRYRPTGVDPGGWHTVSVRVTRPGRLTVQARRGYDGG
jgi:tetratricopeptide (TPR) repeat protein